MGQSMEHLAKITLANLTGGVELTDTMILDAMAKAVAKEQDMTDQLYKSKDKLGGAFDQFSHVVAGMIYDTVNA